MPKKIFPKHKIKLIYTPSASPFILEALGYTDYNGYLIYLADDSDVYDGDGKKIKVSEIIGFEKGKIYTQKSEVKKVETRKVK